MIVQGSARRYRIGIDGLNLAMPKGTGIATYARILGNTLARAGDELVGIFGVDAGDDVGVREALFVERLIRPAMRRRRWLARRLGRFGERLSSRRIVPAEVGEDGLVDRRALGDRLPPFASVYTAPDLFGWAARHFQRTGKFVELVLPDPPDVMHWTYPVPISVAGCPNVYTVHDLIPLKLPAATLDDKPTYRRLIEGCIRHAAAIVTVSQSSAGDIAATFPQAAGRIVNTYQTSDIDLAQGDASSTSVVEALGLQCDGYLLFVGSVEPKKNVGRLLEAYLGQQIATPLVLVAAGSWLDEEELVLLRDGDDPNAPLRRRVIKLEYLPRGVLLSVVRCARAVVFPSLDEGFGLPVHEAMLLGTPVLTSTAPALTEITGGAALHVDPYDVAAIGRGLKEIDASASLRQDLRERGQVMAARFSAERYDAALAALYRKVIDQDGR